MIPFFWAKLTKSHGYVEIDGKLAKFTFSIANVTPEIREQKILLLREEIRKMEEKEHKLERVRDYGAEPANSGLINPETFTDPPQEQ